MAVPTMYVKLIQEVERRNLGNSRASLENPFCIVVLTNDEKVNRKRDD